MRGLIDLNARYGLNFSKSDKSPLDEGLNITQVKDLWPKASERLQTRGPAFKGRALTDSELLRCTWYDLSFLDGKAIGQGGGQPIDGFLSSSNHIEVPHGTYLNRIPCEYSSGEYNFQGPGYTDPGNESANTKVRIDHANWLGNPQERHVFVSGSWGRSGNFGYVEGTRFHNVRVDGAQEDVPNQKFRSYGLMAWKPGEVTDSGRMYMEQFRTSGAIFYAPTPTVIGNFTAFECVESGIRFAGNWGGTVTVAMLSGDANGALFDTIVQDEAGVFDQSGGLINFLGIKNESMVASAGRTHRGQIVGYIRGQFCVRAFVHMAVKDGKVPAMFVVDSRISDGSPQSSWLEVAGKGMNYRYLIHDVRTGKCVPGFGNYAAGKVEYYCDTQEYIHRGRVLQPEFGKATYRTAPLLGATSNQPSLEPGTPEYRHIIMGPPQQQQTIYLDDEPTGPQCQWVLGEPGPWSQCQNGERHRSVPYVSSVDGCTPQGQRPADEIETEDCAVDPPPGGNVIAEFSNFGNTTPNESVPVDFKGVKRIRMTGVTFLAANYQNICGTADNDVVGVKLKPNDRRFYGPDRKPASPPVEVGEGTVNPEVIITLDQAYDMTYMLATPRQGNALLFRCQKLEFLSS